MVWMSLPRLCFALGFVHFFICLFAIGFTMPPGCPGTYYVDQAGHKPAPILPLLHAPTPSSSFEHLVPMLQQPLGRRPCLVEMWHQRQALEDAARPWFLSCTPSPPVLGPVTSLHCAVWLPTAKPFTLPSPPWCSVVLLKPDTKINPPSLELPLSDVLVWWWGKQQDPWLCLNSGSLCTICENTDKAINFTRS